MQEIKVCKFGGTSLADAAQIAKVRELVRGDPQRRYVVVSAPGKRCPDDHKITDLLYLCHEHARQELAFDEVFAPVAQRYRDIVQGLGLSLDIDDALERVRRGISDAAHRGAGPDFAASRGEYLNALIVAQALGYAFVDAAELIFFDQRGRLDEDRTYRTIAHRLGGVEQAVIPGFYGSNASAKPTPPLSEPNGGASEGAGNVDTIKTFGRGGSDVSGAVVARGVEASIYENWTDVSGLLVADPRVVENPRTIDVVTYQELRELAYMGASVLHDEAVFPVRKAGIPVNIRNTNRPGDPGTMIVSQAQPVAHQKTITGIAGKKDFTVIALEKAMMNAQIGFGRRVLDVLEHYDVSFEHLPSGIDTMSIVIEDARLNGKLDDVLEALRVECEPDSIEVFPDMAVIATVGRGMARTPGMAARLFTALAQAQINVRMIDQGSSELNIIVGVAAEDFERAVRAIYTAFVC